MFRGIVADELDIFWPEALDLLRPAIALNRNYSPRELRRSLGEGALQLWCHFSGEIMDMAVVTEIADYRQDESTRRVCTPILLGGENMKSWLKYLAIIEAWAKEKGACVVRIEGREGWERALPDYACLFRSVVLEKEL